MPADVTISDLGVPTYQVEGLRKFKTQAIEVAGTRTSDNETGIFRNVLSPSSLVSSYPHLKTIHDFVENGIKTSPDGPALGRRVILGRDPKTGAPIWSNYMWQTWKRVGERRIDFGRGLVKIYVDLGCGSVGDKWNLGLYSFNRPEWLISEWGAIAFSNATVALYDTLGPEAAEYILAHADVPILVTTADKVPSLLNLIPRLPKLKAIILMESIDMTASTNGDVTAVGPHALLKQCGKEKGVTIYDFAEVELIGKANPIPLRPPSPEDIWCLCYTSGTTGNPKGGILTHSNLVACHRYTEVVLPCTKDDIHMSYLPLAHVYEKMFIASFYVHGAAIGFSRGDVALLMEDIACLRPTVFASVPRLLNRIYDKILQTALESGSAVKAGLFRTALEAKTANLKQGQLTHMLWDRVVFGKIKALLGGRVRAIVSGSAPLSPEVMSFLRAAFACEVLEGYGATETCAGLTITWGGDYTAGHVGPAYACNEIKLVSVPEMGYHARDNKGEIWVRGYNIFKGYHKDPEKTAEALTPDGWYKTGDIGSVDVKGRISIIDRKKNIFKLSQGEYVAPEKLENTYIKSNFIAQVYIHGDSLQSELVAIVVPDPESAIPWGIANNILPSSTPPATAPQPGQPPHPALFELVQNPTFRDAVQADMNKLAKGDKLRGFEVVKKIGFEVDPWTIGNGLLTPSFKLKRAEAAEKYRSVIDKLYAELAAEKAAGDSSVMKAKL